MSGEWLATAYVFADCFEQEGCTSAQGLRDIWAEIHSRKNIDLEQIVWAHCFKDGRVLL